MPISEDLIRALGVAGTGALILLALVWRFGNAKIDLWKKKGDTQLELEQKREEVEIDSMEVTIDALNAARLTSQEVLSRTERERDSYAEQLKLARQMVAEKNAAITKMESDHLEDVGELSKELELAAARYRRLEAEMQQANQWVGQLVAMYEARIARLKKWIRRHNRP